MMKNVTTDNMYYVCKRMVLNGEKLLLRCGPMKLIYQVWDNGKAYDRINAKIFEMESSVDVIFNNTKPETPIQRSYGFIIHRADNPVQIEDVDLIKEVRATGIKPNGNHVNKILHGLNLEVIKLRHNSEISGRGLPIHDCNFDLCPDEITLEDNVDGVRIKAVAALNQIVCDVPGARSFIYKLTITSDNTPSGYTKIIEINKYQLGAMKTDLIGFIIYHKIFDISLFV